MRSPAATATQLSTPTSTTSALSPSMSRGRSKGINASGGRFVAPTHYDRNSESEEEVDSIANHEPSFSLHVPSGLSDSDSDTDGEYPRRRSSINSYVRPLTPVQVALSEVTEQLNMRLKLRADKKVSELDLALLHIEIEEQQAIKIAEEHRQRQQQEREVAEMQSQARQVQERQHLLDSLRMQHEQKAAEEEQRLAAKLKEEQDRKAAADRAAAEKADAEKKAKEAADDQLRKAAATEQQQQQQQDQAAAKQDQEDAKQKKAAESPAQVKQELKHAICTTSPTAQEFREKCAATLAAAQAQVLPFVEDRAMRDAKRSIDKFVTLNVQQISATLEQVRTKGMALVNFMGQQHGLQRTYALLTLAKKLLSQCEVQITRLHSFSFPLAEVAVAVATAHTEFVDILLAQLHKACPMTVPAVYGLRPGGDEIEYLKLQGYKITEGEGSAPPEKESTDEFVGRMQGYVMLYASMTQSDNPRNPHGLQHAWTFLARLLNALPANRTTAVALDAFLKVAGYKLHATYRGQFVKLLQYVDAQFLSELSKSNDPDARAVYTRIQTYLQSRQFMKVPEGRNMPQTDASSHDRA